MDTLPGQLASLHDYLALPLFESLPDKLGLVPDDDYFVHIDDLTRLRLVVKDKAGQSIVVAFYTGQDHLPHHPQLRVGSAIAILYAQQHAFLDGSTGVRLEDAGHLKIFPMALDEMLRLSDRVQQYSTHTSKGEHTCQGCQRKAASLSTCAKCILFHYCGKDCQMVGWSEKNHHKADCKVLQDADFRGLLRLQWSAPDDYRRFPLDARGG